VLMGQDLPCPIGTKLTDISLNYVPKDTYFTYPTRIPACFSRLPPIVSRML
jgi:hypothetical protein